MTHIPGKLDSHIHNPDGTHIATPPSTSGWALEKWYRYLDKHLTAHVIQREKKGPIEPEIGDGETGP